MSLLISVDTLVIAFLAVIVAGLLRSHAEILRRLGNGAAVDSVPRAQSSGVVDAADVSGQDLSQQPASFSMRQSGTATLIGFLTTGCSTCEGFWRDLREGKDPLPDKSRLLLITKDRSEENLSKLRKLAPEHIPVLMSGQAWLDYKVPGSPYFVYVDGSSGKVLGEGAASGWSQVLSLLRDAVEEVAIVDASGSPIPLTTPTWKHEEVDKILAAAGIGPNHPSLYDNRWSEDQVATDLAETKGDETT